MDELEDRQYGRANELEGWQYGRANELEGRQYGRANLKLVIRMEKKFLTLGIESSCDETAVSVVENGRRILSNVISSQIDIHTLYGGVVPEIASRRHLENINGVIGEALKEAGVTLDDIDLIGVTNGPGLIGAVVIGVATAKALSFATGIPIVGVNHMHGHVSANYLQYPDLEPPFISLVVSGGHTNIIEVTDYNKCKVIGGTRDDAAGEAFDKVARVIGLGYPGGPKIDKAARSGDPGAFDFKRVKLDKGSYDFSFSGIKTQVLNLVNRLRMQAGSSAGAGVGAGTGVGNGVSYGAGADPAAGSSANTGTAAPSGAGADPAAGLPVADIAASFQEAVLDVIVEKAVSAALEFDPVEPGTGHQDGPRLVIAGGVAANSRLREKLELAATENGIKLYIPDPVLCTDNGAMIGAAAYYKYLSDGPDDLTLDAYANLDM